MKDYGEVEVEVGGGGGGGGVKLTTLIRCSSMVKRISSDKGSGCCWDCGESVLGGVVVSGWSGGGGWEGWEEGIFIFFCTNLFLGL